jgi:hypothetical protein
MERLSLRIFAAVLVACGVVPLANVLTEGSAVPWYSGAVKEWTERGLLLLVIALLASRGAGQRVDKAIRGARALLMRPSNRAFAVGAAVAAIVGAVFVALWALGGQPFTSDEMAQQFHARILASGHLTARPEALREFFNTAPVLDRGDWFSQYPIGGPALIALGVLVSAPWIVNPLLLGLTTLALYRFFERVGGELTARGATVLFVLSPMVLVMAGSQMNHVAALAAAACALWAAANWDFAETSRDQMRFAAATGAALGVLATVRPLDAVLVTIVIGGVQITRAVAHPARWRSIGVQAVAGAVPIALLLWVNASTTGSPMLFGYDALNGPAHGLGFHLDPNGDAHTPLRGLTLASGYLLRLNLFLFEWPVPAVLIIAVGLVAIRSPWRWDLALAALMAVFLIGYGAYWFDGFFAGPRFLFTAIPAFVYFAARAPSIVGKKAPAISKRTAALMIPLCMAVAWFGPWGVSSASSRIALYRDQRTKLKTDVESQARTESVDSALVFVNEGWRGSLQARLRVLGANQFTASRLLGTLDACALQTALDAADADTAPDSAKLATVLARARAAGVPRPVPNLPADQAIALVLGSSPTPTCLREFSRDSLGTMPYALFLARQHVGSNGRVGGNIVYARDLGARNELLRPRFGDRTWYRYRPARGLGDTSRVFIPYTP